MRRKPLFPPPHNAAGRRLRHKGRQVYSLLTVNGRVYLWRIRWHDAQEGSQTPLDRMLDEAERAISEGVREMACRLNRGATSFEQTARNLARTAHVHASKETLRGLIEAEGRGVIAAQQRGQLAPDWEAADCRTESGAGPTRVYLGADGVMVPLITDAEKQTRRAAVKKKRQQRGKKCRPLPPRKTGADQQYKEFKIVTFYDEEQERRYVAGTSGNHTAAGKMMQRMATQIRQSEAQEKIGNIDGSPWIRNEIEFYGLVDALGLDYYHLRENVQKARAVVYGADPAGQAWRDEIMGLFCEQGYDAVWDRLVAWRAALRGGKREAADGLMSYMAERRTMIRYPEFRERGWQIGSGPTEAQCKSATQRIKGRGRRWDRPNAEGVMALDCLESSHAWNLYWTTLDPERN